MKDYRVEINANEDFDLIENCEEREAAKENFKNEINIVECLLENLEKSIELDYDKITDGMFSVSIPDYEDIKRLEESISFIISDECYITVESYEEA